MSNKDDSQDKPKLGGAIATPKFKRGIKGFLTDTSREMKKVTWPTRKETSRLTVVVISLVVIIAVMLSLMGWVSDGLVAIVTKGHI